MRKDECVAHILLFSNILTILSILAKRNMRRSASSFSASTTHLVYRDNIRALYNEPETQKGIFRDSNLRTMRTTM